jgi:threonine dehydrogenase-like Zn-dependent dehydrogenase
MKAGYIEAVQKAFFRDDLPEPEITAGDQVKIRVKACGICGSEVHAYHGRHPFRIPPLVSGHEFAGEVVAVGKDVTLCRVGDRVTAEPQYGCGKCVFCLEGAYNICPSKKVLGSNGWSGSFGEYIVVPQQTIIRLPDNVSFEEGALIEPIAVGMHAVRAVPLDKDSAIAIIGSGTIGLGILLSARVFGPKEIIMIDVVDYNLQKALEMGCTQVINSSREDVVAKIMELTDNAGVDMTYLAFGNEPVVHQAAEITKRGCTLHEIALIPDGVGFPYGLLQQKELMVNGYNMYVYDDFEAVCKAIAEGKINLSNFITQRYPIEKFSEAMEMADKRPEPMVKLMLKF